MQRDYGHIHNTILNVANDAEHSIDVMPGLMKVMLEDGGWREFRRPLDGKEFTNNSVEEWVLGPAYAGLGFPNWETLYGVLECNLEYGQRVIDLLVAEGAPTREDVDIEFTCKKAKSIERPGQGARTDRSELGVNNTKLQRGSTNAAYLAKRLQESHPKTFEALERGEFKSVRAAAKSAGIVRDPTPLETLQRTWRKASDDERAAFRDYIDTPVMDRREAE